MSRLLAERYLTINNKHLRRSAPQGSDMPVKSPGWGKGVKAHPAVAFAPCTITHMRLWVPIVGFDNSWEILRASAYIVTVCLSGVSRLLVRTTPVHPCDVLGFDHGGLFLNLLLN
jgi:hypothetical protein